MTHTCKGLPLSFCSGCNAGRYLEMYCCRLFLPKSNYVCVRVCVCVCVCVLSVSSIHLLHPDANRVASSSHDMHRSLTRRTFKTKRIACPHAASHLACRHSALCLHLQVPEEQDASLLTVFPDIPHHSFHLKSAYKTVMVSCTRTSAAYRIRELAA